MQKRAYLGLGFSLALGILFLGLSTAGTALAQTIQAITVTVPATGGTVSLPGVGTLTIPPGAVPAGSTLTLAELAAPPPGTTQPAGTVDTAVVEIIVDDPAGARVTTFAVPATMTGTGSICTILDPATGVFEELVATPIGGGMIECVLPRPGIIAFKALVAPPPVVPEVPEVPVQVPVKVPEVPVQVPVKAGVAPAQVPLALPRTGGESLPLGALALAGLLLTGAGVATRRFGRRS